MNHKVKRKWLAALRGGSWQQIRGALAINGTNNRCALGVLKEVVNCDPSDWRRFARKAGLQDSDGMTIVYMNDEVRCSFGKIADWIEENVKET